MAAAVTLAFSFHKTLFAFFYFMQRGLFRALKENAADCIAQMLPGSDEFENRIAHGGEFFFIFCQNVFCIHNRIVMQIQCMGIYVPAGILNFFQRKIKETSVVCFKFNMAQRG